jgi:hypothetical protein
LACGTPEVRQNNQEAIRRLLYNTEKKSILKGGKSMKARIITLTLMSAFIAVVVLAQGPGKGPGNGPGPMFRYDSSAETTINGTIEEIKTLDMMCQTGTHLTVKTDKGNVEVALGPAQFLSDQKLELKKGDQVQIIGAKANMRRGDMFMARQVTSGGKTVTLRDEKGMPAWQRGMCRQS